jgi:hypothetical protein
LYLFIFFQYYPGQEIIGKEWAPLQVVFLASKEKQNGVRENVRPKPTDPNAASGEGGLDLVGTSGNIDVVRPKPTDPNAGSGEGGLDLVGTSGNIDVVRPKPAVPKAASGEGGIGLVGRSGDIVHPYDFSPVVVKCFETQAREREQQNERDQASQKLRELEKAKREEEVQTDRDYSTKIFKKMLYHADTNWERVGMAFSSHNFHEILRMDEKTCVGVLLDGKEIVQK